MAIAPTKPPVVYLQDLKDFKLCRISYSDYVCQFYAFESTFRAEAEVIAISACGQEYSVAITSYVAGLNGTIPFTILDYSSWLLDVRLVGGVLWFRAEANMDEDLKVGHVLLEQDYSREQLTIMIYQIKCVPGYTFYAEKYHLHFGWQCGQVLEDLITSFASIPNVGDRQICWIIGNVIPWAKMSGNFLTQHLTVEAMCDEHLYREMPVRLTQCESGLTLDILVTQEETPHTFDLSRYSTTIDPCGDDWETVRVWSEWATHKLIDWEVISYPAWIEGRLLDKGGEKLQIDATLNCTMASRSGTLTVRQLITGETLDLAISQDYCIPHFTLSSYNITGSACGGLEAPTLNSHWSDRAPTPISWHIDPNTPPPSWVSVSPQSGTPGVPIGPVYFNFSRNCTFASRSTTLHFIQDNYPCTNPPNTGLEFTVDVSQPYCTPVFTAGGVILIPDAHTPNCGGQGTTQIVSEWSDGVYLPWEIVSYPSWLTVTKTSTSIQWSAPPNHTFSARSGTVVLRQRNSPCTNPQYTGLMLNISASQPACIPFWNTAQTCQCCPVCGYGETPVCGNNSTPAGVYYDWNTQAAADYPSMQDCYAGCVPGCCEDNLTGQCVGSGTVTMPPSTPAPPTTTTPAAATTTTTTCCPAGSSGALNNNIVPFHPTMIYSSQTVVDQGVLFNMFEDGNLVDTATFTGGNSGTYQLKSCSNYLFKFDTIHPQIFINYNLVGGGCTIEDIAAVGRPHWEFKINAPSCCGYIDLDLEYGTITRRFNVVFIPPTVLGGF